LGKEIPKDLEEKRQQVVETLKSSREQNAPIFEWFSSNTEEIEKLRSEKNFNAAFLITNQMITQRQIDSLYEFSKLQFECGLYESSLESLSIYLPLSIGPNGEKTEKYFSALWGKLAGNILSKNWKEARFDLEELRDLIDSSKFGNSLDQLQQRSWLLNWSLFVYFNLPDGFSGIVDLFLQPSYLNALQSTSPHLLRYLTAAVICNTQKRRRSDVTDLVRVLQQEEYEYQDPITDFVKSLLVLFDFEEAQLKLRECEKVLSNDYFLHNSVQGFIENARLFIFETYCRIHRCIDIQMLAEKLSMEDKEQAELWIVNLIRNAKLDAKIDSARGHVIMGNKSPSIYEHIVDKTKSLYFQSNQLASYLLQE